MAKELSIAAELSKLNAYRNTLVSSVITALVALFFLYRMNWVVSSLPFEKDCYTPVFFIACFPLFVLLPLATLPVMKDPRLFGLGPGRWRTWLLDVAILYGAALLFLFPAVKLGILGDTYPLWKKATLSLGLFLLYEGSHFVYLFACEFLFRGFLMFSLRKEIGDTAAVCVQMIPFAILHAGKPEVEAYSSVVAGLLLGILAFRGRSVWPCVILHFLVALTVDILCVA